MYFHILAWLPKLNVALSRPIKIQKALPDKLLVGYQNSTLATQNTDYTHKDGIQCEALKQKFVMKLYCNSVLSLMNNLKDVGKLYGLPDNQ